MLLLSPDRRSKNDTGQNGLSGQEAMVDTRPLLWRDHLDNTRLAEGLFKLATVNKKEWGVYDQEKRCCCKRMVRCGQVYCSEYSFDQRVNRVSSLI